MMAGEQSETAMAHGKKARAIGFNHVALEVGDIDEALAFYGRLFEFELDHHRSEPDRLSHDTLAAELTNHLIPGAG
jgi:catechol 2,3-dioxygenase-like lactoylglutathione lyase family enzyme